MRNFKELCVKYAAAFWLLFIHVYSVYYTITHMNQQITLDVGSASEGWRYTVTLLLVGWAHNRMIHVNDPVLIKEQELGKYILRAR